MTEQLTRLPVLSLMGYQRMKDQIHPSHPSVDEWETFNRSACLSICKVRSGCSQRKKGGSLDVSVMLSLRKLAME